MLKRTIAAIIAILLLAAIFASCKDNSDKKIIDTNSVTESQIENETVETKNQDARIMPDLPDMDFDGRVYRVLGRDNATYSQFINFEIDAEEITGEPVNDAVYNRNRKLEEKYNIIIEQVLQEDPNSVLSNSVKAGDDEYSLAFLWPWEIHSAAAYGLFCDLNSLQYLDFKKPWWNQKINEALSITKKLYFTTSDFNMMDKNRTYMVVYNKTLSKEFDFGNLYDLVYSGKWTVDKMIEYCKLVSFDLDGNGEMGPDDRWGLGYAGLGEYIMFFSGCDNYITKKDNGDYPVLSINNEHTINSIDKLLRLTNDKQISFYCQEWEGKVSYPVVEASGIVFGEGRLLFSTALTHSLKYWTQTYEVDYGVLPFPKYDENQKDYITPLDLYAGALFGIPTTVQDTGFAAFMLEALSAASKYEVLPYYYELSTKTKYTQDEESAKMLDLIFSSIQHDLGFLFDWGNIRSIFNNIIPATGTNVFVSEYEKIEDKVLNDIEKTVNLFKEIS